MAEEAKHDSKPKLAGILKNTEKNVSNSISQPEPAKVLSEAQVKKTDSSNSVLITVPSDGGYAWIVVFAAFCLNFLVDGAMFSLGKLLPNIKEEYQTSTVHVALIFSLMHAMYFIFSPFAGTLINRFGFRSIGVLGSAISALCFYVVSGVENIYLVMMFYAFAGIGFAMITSSSIICINLHFDLHRSLATAISTCGSGLGIFALEPIISSLFFHHGYEIKGFWRTFTEHESYFLVANIALILSCTPPKSIKLSMVPEDDEDQVNSDSSQESSNNNSEEEKSSKIYIRYLERSTLNMNQRITQHRESLRMRRASGRKSFTSNPFPKLAEIVEVPETVSNFKNLKTPDDDPYKVMQPRPLYKDDILFDRTPSFLSYVKSHISSMTIDDPRTRISTQLLLTRIPPKTPGKSMQHIQNAMKIVFDLSLIKSSTFVVILLSGGIFMFGNFIPFAYVTANAISSGIAVEDAMWLVSVIGLCGPLGRMIVAGYLMMPCRIEITIFTGLAFILNGCYSIVFAFESKSLIHLLIFCALHGLSNSIQFAMRPIIYVKTFGMEQLTNAYGLSSICKGICVLVGVPLIGYIEDRTGDWTWVFLSSGIIAIISGLLMCFLTLVKSREISKNRRVSFGESYFQT